MSINTDKTFFISYANKHDPIKCKYHLNNTINELTSTKDLGVIFDSKLSFNQHINSVYTKAYRSLGFIHHRSIEFQNSSTLIYLYKTLTLPILEYRRYHGESCYIHFSQCCQSLFFSILFWLII